MGRIKWNVPQEDGKNAGRCDGNGNAKDWKKKNAKGNWEEPSDWIYISEIEFV